MNFLRKLNKRLNFDGNLILNPKTDLFRNLSYIEAQAVEVYDFRNLTDIKLNNNVIITCEHASNNEHKYKFPEDQKKWLDTHWGYDIGAKDMGLDLSENSEILSLFSNFSRLIIDPNRSLLSNTLVRKFVEGDVELGINKEVTLDIDKRIELFYLPYYKIMREVLNFVKPQNVLIVHSFTKQYEQTKERDLEVGILYRERGRFAEMIESAYEKNNVKYKINQPYDANDSLCNVLDSVQAYNWPDFRTDVVMLEFRNDYCSDIDFRKKQVEILSPIIESLRTRI